MCVCYWCKAIINIDIFLMVAIIGTVNSENFGERHSWLTIAEQLQLRFES